MSGGLIVYVEAGGEGRAEALSRERVSIGAGADCDVRLPAGRAGPVPPLLLALVRADGHYEVTDFAPSTPVSHNGNPLARGDRLNAGDEVRADGCGVALRFFPLGGPPAVLPERVAGAHVAPFIEQAALEASATPRRDDARMFLREFARELAREIGVGTKLLVLAVVAALAGGVIFLGVSAYREFGRGSRLDEEQNRKLDEQSRRVTQTGEEVTRIGERLAGAEESSREILNSLSLAPMLWGRYNRGVCLIVCSIIFVERGTGRPLRYPKEVLNEEGEPVLSPFEPPLFTPEGAGPVYETEYVGTGFHVGGGYVLTNRHIAAEPLGGDARAQVLSALVGGSPRVRGMLAYFPGRREPIPLKLKLAAKRDDLAVCMLAGKDSWADIPALPLEENGDAPAVGKAVLMMGYPGGPDRMLAQLPEEKSREMQTRYGDSLKGLIAKLSESGLVRPLTTQGHITDLSKERVMYDAATAEGGSGAPVFGPSGRVIGVNFAALREGGYSNFAVPVGGANTLLRRAGWKRE